MTRGINISEAAWPNPGYDPQNTSYNPDLDAPVPENPTDDESRLTLRGTDTTLAFAGGKLAWYDGAGPTLWTFNPETLAIQGTVPLSGAGGHGVAVSGEAFFLTVQTTEGFVVTRVNFDGSPGWSFTEEPGNTDPEPAKNILVEDGRVYQPSENAEGAPLVVLDTEDGSLLWEYQTGLDGGAGPAVDGDTVIFLNGRDDQLVSLNAVDGSENYSRDIDDNALGPPPAISGGKIYFSDGAGDLVAHDLDSGNEAWRVSPFSGESFSPAVADHIVYYLEISTGNIEARDAEDGGRVWNNTGNGGGASAPSIAGKHVYVQDANNGLVAYDRFDGTVDWTFDVTGGQPVDSNIMLAPGVIYVYTATGSITRVVEG